MARGATKRKPRAQQDAPRRPSGSSSRRSSVANDGLFFTRLRRQAKWIFVFLALVFAGSFVVYGVGTGQGGLGDIFDLGGGGGNSGPSVSKARDRVEKNPKDAQGYRDLATALINDNKPEEAIPVLERYSELRPKDVDALTELAGLYLNKAQRWADEARRLELVELAIGAPTFGLDGGGQLAQALGTDPIYAAVSSALAQERNAAIAEYRTAASQAVAVYKKITKLRPNDASSQLQLAQTAEVAGDYQTAVDAYKRFLKLAPDSPDAPRVRQIIKQLEKLLKSQQPTGAG